MDEKIKRLDRRCTILERSVEIRGGDAGDSGDAGGGGSAIIISDDEASIHNDGVHDDGDGDDDNCDQTEDSHDKNKDVEAGNAKNKVKNESINEQD